MNKYEDTVMTAIKELEEKLDYGMEVDDEPAPKPQNPTKKPEGMVGKLKNTIGMKWNVFEYPNISLPHLEQKWPMP